MTTNLLTSSASSGTSAVSCVGVDAATTQCYNPLELAVSKLLINHVINCFKMLMLTAKNLVHKF